MPSERRLPVHWAELRMAGEKDTVPAVLSTVSFSCGLEEALGFVFPLTLLSDGQPRFSLRSVAGFP